MSRPSTLLRIRRALGRRCPVCGQGRLFRHWVRMREVCPRCGLRLDRGEPDYFLGSYVVNFVAAELLVAFGLAGAVAWTWPEVPWDRIELALYLLVAPAPVLFYPVAKTLWLAIDLTFRPPEPKDFEPRAG